MGKIAVPVAGAKKKKKDVLGGKGRKKLEVEC